MIGSRAVVALQNSLLPGESYESELTFRLPADAAQLRLLITSPGWEERLLIGDENSLGHKKSYLAVPGADGLATPLPNTTRSERDRLVHTFHRQS